MSTQDVQILDPTTGELVAVCRGPTATGKCPRAGKNGVVPCAGCLLLPPHADHRLWPMSVPADYRFCELGWNARALTCLDAAETCRVKWEAGAARETERVFARAAAGDPRYRKMTPRELKTTGRWRWRLSTSAIQLARAEEKHRERASMYLSFAEFRRLSALPLH
jgi:hypothetical protein